LFFFGLHTFFLSWYCLKKTLAQSTSWSNFLWKVKLETNSTNCFYSFLQWVFMYNVNFSIIRFIFERRKTIWYWTLQISNTIWVLLCSVSLFLCWLFYYSEDICEKNKSKKAKRIDCCRINQCTCVFELVVYVLCLICFFCFRSHSKLNEAKNQ
jgi:hypothetical protein